MSLFDAIKYPISDPPTLDQLFALPDNLLKDWITVNGWVNTMRLMENKQTICQVLSEFYERRFVVGRDIGCYKTEIKILRTMIKEYDELI